MAQVLYRVSGRRNGKKVRQSFRNTYEGREAARAFARSLKDATTVYDVRTQLGGRAVMRKFRTRREADAFAATAKVDRLHGVGVDPREGRRSFADVAKGWLSANGHKRASSIARDRSILNIHLLPVYGNRPIGSITRSDVKALVDRWVASGQAPATVGRQLATLRAIMADAELADLIGRNPCRGVRRPTLRLIERPELDAAQLCRLAEVLGDEYGLFMWCGVELGCRWAEVAGLSVSSIDMLRKTVTIRQQVNRGGSLSAPKTETGRRTLDIGNEMLELFGTQLARRGLTVANPGDLIFVAEAGRPLHYSNWRHRVWLPACEAAGLRGLRFHDLRSMNASTLVAAGVDIKTAQARLGHASPAMTLGIYARATREGGRNAAVVLVQRLREVGSGPNAGRLGHFSNEAVGRSG